MPFDLANPLIQVAFITGGVTVVGVLVNVISAAWIKRIEFARQHKDRVFERRASNVDELVNQLDVAIQELSDRSERITGVSRNVLNLIQTEFSRRKSKHRIRTEPFKWEGTLEAMLSELTPSNKPTEWTWKREKWFTFTAVRLTFWLENSDLLEKRLSEIEKEFSLAHFLLDETQVALPGYISEFPKHFEELTDAHLSEAARFHQEDLEDVEVIKNAIREAVGLQRDLIELMWRGRLRRRRVMLSPK